MGTFKKTFYILIVQIPGLGRTLHLTKDMNDQMVEFGLYLVGFYLKVPKCMILGADYLKAMLHCKLKSMTECENFTLYT